MRVNQVLARCLIAACSLAAIAATAAAQNVSPGVEYFLGPTIGKQWGAPDVYFPLQLNAQMGTTYTVVASDWGKVLTFANGSPVAVTLPTGTTANFPLGKCFILITTGAGTVTVTPGTFTINGQSTKTYATSAGGKICNTGAAYLAY